MLLDANTLWNKSAAPAGHTSRGCLDVLLPRNTSGIRSAIGDHQGRYLEFLRFERRAPAKSFNNFTLHQVLVMVVRNERGEEERLDCLRAVVERRGRFKIYSMRD